MMCLNDIKGSQVVTNNNNNNSLRLYSTFLGTQSTLHGRGNLLNHHQMTNVHNSRDTIGLFSLSQSMSLF